MKARENNLPPGVKLGDLSRGRRQPSPSWEVCSPQASSLARPMTCMLVLRNERARGRRFRTAAPIIMKRGRVKVQMRKYQEPILVELRRQDPLIRLRQRTCHPDVGFVNARPESGRFLLSQELLLVGWHACVAEVGQVPCQVLSRCSGTCPHGVYMKQCACGMTWGRGLISEC